MRVLVAWPQVSTMENPRGWAYRVGFNMAKSRFRRVGAERRAMRRLGVDPVEDQSSEPNLNRIDLRTALAGLTRRQCQAVIGRYYLDLTLPDLAESMNCSLGTAKVHLRDGLRMLRAAGLEVDDEEVIR